MNGQVKMTARRNPTKIERIEFEVDGKRYTESRMTIIENDANALKSAAIDAALAWFKDNDWRDVHALECAQLDWYDSDGERDKPDCTCAFGRLVKQLEAAL